MVIIQQITVVWTKKSRGAPWATRRNRVPKAISFTPADCNCLYECYGFAEAYDFKQELITRQILDQIPHKLSDLLLEYQNNELVIGTHWEQSWEKPARYDKTAALRLIMGQYGRLLVNWRHLLYDYGDESIHWYSQDIWNIAIDDHPTPDLFIFREPDQLCDLRAHLF
jgi:hypothetical protein